MPKKKYVNQNFYAADGGRAGYANGMLVDDEDDEDSFMQDQVQVKVEDNLWHF